MNHLERMRAAAIALSKASRGFTLIELLVANPDDYTTRPGFPTVRLAP
jgi:hypothetical protein